MVALLVVGTIIMCLLVDGIVMSVRQNVPAVQGTVLKESPVLVFAQDGGEKLEEDDTKKQEVCKVNKTPKHQ